ncbi:unnamed protein product [Lactuca saligna]|uniref:Uncharacterized protein n=1 Tax=Lactuca saligna TaxID=75948 RepID=A0AA35ZLU5_LACSI|nr:unnamed protein product [Lactuca saligna]
MLGIPMGDQKVEDLSFRPAKDECYSKWISQFHKAENIRLNDITNAIISSKEADFNFKLNFIVLFCNTLVESTPAVNKDRVHHKFYNIDGEPENLEITQNVQTTLENQHLPKACVQVEHIIEGERLRKLLNDLRQSNYSEQDINSILNITKEQLKEFDDFFHKSKEISNVYF